MKLRKLFSIIYILFIIFVGYSSGILFSTEYIQGKIQPIITTVKKLPLKDHSSFSKKSSYNGLVHVVDYSDAIIIDLRYATTNNFTGKKVYQKDVCLLQKGTLDKLIEANKEFMKLGYRIKLWDAYRPPQVQQYFWDIVKDSRFIASPYANWSRHNRGAAVDVTLVDENLNELKMPTGFDEFSINAYRNNPKMSTEAKKNMDLLTSVMVKHGFNPIQTEWWHFDDAEADKYPVINLSWDDIN